MWLRRAGVSALLVTDRTNVRYLTGIDISSGLILLKNTGGTLFVDDRYIECVNDAWSGMTVRHVRELADVLRRVRRCGFEVEHVTVARREAWRKNFPQTLFVPCKDVIECRRRRKRPDELRALRRAGRITEELLRRIPAALRARPTGRE